MSKCLYLYFPIIFRERGKRRGVLGGVHDVLGFEWVGNEKDNEHGEEHRSWSWNWKYDLTRIALHQEGNGKSRKTDLKLNPCCLVF